MTAVREVTVARALCCSKHHKGPRWLLAVYFYRSKRLKSGIQPYCMTCTKISMRAANLSERTKQNRAEYARRHKERQRRAKGVPVRNLTNPRFDGKKVARYLKRFMVKESGLGRYNVKLFLNGVEMTPVDQRFYHQLRSGEIKFTGQRRIDKLCLRYDLPLWELVEEAGRYQVDKRNSGSGKKVS